MRLSALSVFLCLLFMSYLLFVLQAGKADGTNKLLVGSANIVNKERADCVKDREVDCRKPEGEGGGSEEETLFDNEDYIYTQSVP